MNSTQQTCGRSQEYGVAVGAMTAASDGEIIARVLVHAEQDAFAILVTRYSDAVLNLAYRLLGNGPEAEDVAQEAFLRAYTQLPTYKPAHKFSTWLLSIASHLSIDHLRRRRFLALPLDAVPFLEQMAAPGADPEQAALVGEQQDEVQASLCRIPAKYRAVIVLRFWYDFSYEEIASALGLTSTMVKARLHRGRELLARALLEEAEQVGVGGEWTPCSADARRGSRAQRPRMSPADRNPATERPRPPHERSTPALLAGDTVAVTGG